MENLAKSFAVCELSDADYQGLKDGKILLGKTFFHQKYIPPGFFGLNRCRIAWGIQKKNVFFRKNAEKFESLFLESHPSIGNLVGAVQCCFGPSPRTT